MTPTVGSLLQELGSVLGDERVLRAVAEVPRQVFLPRDLRERAWENVALPIAAGQTISQPGIVARMCELLQLSGNEIVLDIGTGSGYHAAVLSRLSAHVYSIERHAELTRAARQALESCGIANVTLLTGDGTRGLADHAPYDAINVAARSEDVPAALQRQLAPGGRLVIPIKGAVQRLVVLQQTGTAIRQEEHELVSFVPLVSTPRTQGADDARPASE